MSHDTVVRDTAGFKFSFFRPVGPYTSILPLGDVNDDMNFIMLVH